MRRKALFRVDRVTDYAVYLTDVGGDGPYPSVTNDAEEVCLQLYRDHGDKRFCYVDSMGERDELVHSNGVFNTFRSGWPTLPGQHS